MRGKSVCVGEPTVTQLILFQPHHPFIAPHVPTFDHPPLNDKMVILKAVVNDSLAGIFVKLLAPLI